MNRLSPIDPPAQALFDFVATRKTSLTVPEVERILRCGRSQVYLLIEDGTLQAIDISRKSPLDPDSERRHRRVLTESVREFLRKRRTV